MKCNCQQSGWCLTHKRNMHAAQVSECRNKPGYFAAYHKGAKQRSDRGLGDTIARITHATGIDRLAKMLASAIGKDCGCSERQERLNQAVPYREPPDNNTHLGPS